MKLSLAGSDRYSYFATNLNITLSYSWMLMDTILFSRLSIVAFVFVFSACGTTLENVDFGWPVEARLTVSNTNTVEETRSPTAFNVAKIALDEFEDSTALKGSVVRIIRSSEGFYFLTGPRFKNVYVFSPGPHELRLISKIEVSQTGLKDPALNQRPPYVELVDGSGLRLRLTSDDIAEASQ